ncbi:MAG: C25 family cysteine peptidase, partial [Fibrobacteria bacterium]
MVSSDAAGLTLAWKRASGGDAGAARPRTLALALPPGHSASAAIEPAGNAGGTAMVSPASRFRDAAIAALTFDPAPGSASATLRISFRKMAGAPAYRAAFAPGEDTPAELHLRGWIANYAQSRGFRSAPASALAKSSADGPSAGASLPKRRLVIRTRDENIETLSYDSLRNAGVPLSGIDPRLMHLYHDGREIPMFIGGEEDGRWDRGDYLEFIGKRAAGQNTYNSFYASRACFILTWEGGRLGLRAPAVPVASRTGGIVPVFPADAKEAPPFRIRQHFEEDVDILRIGSTSAEEIIDLGSRVQEAELTDFWMWKRLGAEKDLAEAPFTLPYTPAAAAGGGSIDVSGNGSLRVTVNLKGITNNPDADPDHHLKFLLNGSDISLVGGVKNDAVWEGQESHTWVSQPLNPSVLKAGKNVLVIQKVNDLRTAEGQLVETQDAYLNFIDLDFPATYKVLDDRLAFNNSFGDSAGLKLFTLTGFTGDDISLWDKQGRKLTNFRTIRRADGFEVAFLDTLTGRTDYLASSAGKREIPSVALDTLDDLLDKSQGADYLVITQREMLGKGLDSLVEFRAKQGMRTRVVMARHIYQAFGDGSLDPAAIRRFVAYAYANWARPAPAYLVLVGDASSGFDKYGETIVPYHPVNIRGWGVAANDDYFAKVSGDDDLADLFVGRIPAANRQQLSNLVRKTLTLETTRPQGHWSNQVLLISGFESSFTAQNYVLQGLASANDRQYSRLDLFPGSPHYKSAAQRADFFSQIDSGFNLVSFVGHGGGSVWSDAGVLTLKALDEGKLKGDYPVTLISSITCLTGFFEDISARSLGEELVRMPRGGTAGFYGASGYISNLAGEALSEEVLKAATGNAFATTGAIVTQAETMVKLRTGDTFLPILAEFNLLGDPALGISFPRREGGLALAPRVLAGGASLEAKGTGLAVAEGGAVATVLLGDSTESNTVL